MNYFHIVNHWMGQYSMNNFRGAGAPGTAPSARHPEGQEAESCSATTLTARRAVAAFAEFHQCLHAQQPSCWEDLELTMPQFKALMLVSATGGLSGRDLARRFGVGPSAITAIVDRLVQRGYVRREEDVNDRRITWTRPTPAALALFQQVNAGHDEQLHQILGSLPPDQLEIVERALLVLRDAGARWVAEQSGDAGRVDPEAEDRPPATADDAAVPGAAPRPSHPRGADSA